MYLPRLLAVVLRLWLLACELCRVASASALLS